LSAAYFTLYYKNNLIIRMIYKKSLKLSFNFLNFTIFSASVDNA
jgi:hypothetical protein